MVTDIELNSNLKNCLDNIKQAKAIIASNIGSTFDQRGLWQEQ